MKEQSPPQKLTRSRDDRFIGGVAAGIATRLKVDPVFVRIAFLASVVLGGIGLLAYVVLLAVMPVEGDPAEPMPPIEPRRRNMMIGLAVLVGFICLATADSGNFASWLFGFWPGVVFGIFLWIAAIAVAAWFVISNLSGNDSPPASFPDSDPRPADPSTEVVTYAQSPTQLSTEVMETRPMPAEPGPDPADAQGSSGTAAAKAPERDNGPSTIGKIMVWFAIGLTALIVFSILFTTSAAITALAGGVPMAVLVIVLGGGMVFAGIRGRRQISLWLLAAAIAITLPMAAVSIADLRIEGSYGEINETPLSVVEVPKEGYEMAAGNMTIDLRRFDFRDGTLQLPVKSGMGLTSIIVRDDVCVIGDIEGKAGVASIRGRQQNGFSVDLAAQTPPDFKVFPDGGNPDLVNLDARFKLGAFEVVDDTQWRQLGRGGSFEDDDLEQDDRAAAEARERATAACAPRPASLEMKQEAKARS